MTELNYQHGGEASRERRKQLRLSWFGPSRSEAWALLAREMGARHEKHFWRGDRVVAKVGRWQIVLDTVHVDKITYTRMRAPYANADGFRFCVFRKHFLSGLVEALGFQDVKIGDAEFDEAFVVRGNEEPKLRRLFADAGLRRWMLAQPKLKFEVRDDEGFFRPRFPEGVDELRFFVPGVIKDVDRLKGLYELFAATLQRLCEMGSAYERDPGVTLT